MWLYLVLFYISAVLVLIAFFAGAANVNQKWDRAADRRLRRREQRRRAA
jgi:hypothetical protein